MTAAEYTWRDSELRSPPLRAFNAAGSALRKAGFDRPRLTPESVVAAAIKQAGSDDFGTASYREPLEVFTAACRDEAELTTFGRFLVGKMLQRALANRLALQSWADVHPEVRAQTIASPWVIVGCRAPAPAFCRSCSGSTRGPGRCCSGKPRTRSRRSRRTRPPPTGGSRRQPRNSKGC